MAIEFKLPELGENIESADIVKILVAEGDQVKVDQILFEIETDKATVEVPSDVEGVISKILVKEGSTAKVGDVLFLIEAGELAESSEVIPPAESENSDQRIESEKPEEPEKPNETAQPATIVEFNLPELGENIESADVTKILVNVGDTVQTDQSVIEIETDKATVEVPIEFSGVVKEIKVKEGDNVKVGAVIFVLETTETGIAKAAEKPSVVPQQVESTQPTESAKPVEPAQPAKITKPETDKIAPAAPSVRRFAREIGIDIHQVEGSGPGGRISVDDVKAFAKSLNEGRSQTVLSGGVVYQPLPDFSKWGEVEHQVMTNIRKKTAQHLSNAWSTVPHVTQFDKADITELEKLRKDFGKKTESMGGKLTVTAILIKIVASALKVFPQFNSSLDIEKNEVIFKKFYNIGVAVDTEWGLLVPVIKNVDEKNITQLAVELNEMSVKAKTKKLTIDEMQGGTFTISNLGGIGGTYFTPIVNSPEVAILGVSRASFEPVYQGAHFEPGLMMPLSLSYDHRIIDGADAIRFLRWIVNALEEPFLLSLEG
ncbi:dihydrolipoyllysine-residue acetyltransferase [Bacteroidota bacterium]